MNKGNKGIEERLKSEIGRGKEGGEEEGEKAAEEKREKGASGYPLPF